MGPKLRGIGLPGRGVAVAPGGRATVVASAVADTDRDYVEAKVGENGRVFFENGQGQEKLVENNRRGDEDIFQNSASPAGLSPDPDRDTAPGAGAGDGAGQAANAPTKKPGHVDPLTRGTAGSTPITYHSAFSPLPSSALQIPFPSSPPTSFEDTSGSGFLTASEQLATPVSPEAADASKARPATTPPVGTPGASPPPPAAGDANGGFEGTAGGVPVVVAPVGVGGGGGGGGSTAPAAAAVSAAAAPKKARLSYENLKITMKIGRGRFGDVYRVTNKNDKCEIYALKKVSYCSSSEEVKNITWSKRPKKHLLTSHTAYWSRSRNEVCILMEYMPYGSLQDYVENMKKSGKRVSDHDLNIVAMSMIDGLYVLEKRHMVHRDIKPANILIGAGGIVKIGDFGVSRITEKNDNSQAYTQVGSEIWLAPERLEGKGYSYPSDIYSFGLVLAYCGLGHCPVDQFTENRQVSLQAIHEEKLAAGESVEMIDSRVAELVSQCTHTDPQRRPNAKTLMKKYEAIPQFKALIDSGVYGVDVSTLHPFHEDDIECLLTNDSPSLEGGETCSSYAEGTPVGAAV